MLSSHSVFSTLVEVFPKEKSPRIAKAGLLHARGGVSLNACGPKLKKRSSPRSWRCFHYECLGGQPIVVFSTLVEVFHSDDKSPLNWFCLLHARGGVSLVLMYALKSASSSPRSWRCFSRLINRLGGVIVFSTLVEVFLLLLLGGGLLLCLLHARGGVSAKLLNITPQQTSSPRSWRCFLNLLGDGQSRLVFSTLVEVFLLFIKFVKKL